MRRLALILAALTCLSGCRHELSAQDVPVAGLIPRLSLAMTDAATGKTVTGADFRGETVLLYFGYTNCPDVCPATLYNVDKLLRRLGPAAAAKVRVVFVTVDPDRDNAAQLAQYVALFGPQMVGLRGTADQLYELARRYRVVFSVTKRPVYSVTHSAAIYVFDAHGAPRFLIAGLDTNQPDIKGITADLAEVVKG